MQRSILWIVVCLISGRDEQHGQEDCSMSLPQLRPVGRSMTVGKLISAYSLIDCITYEGQFIFSQTVMTYSHH